jgi:hypothetical protein
MLVVLDNATTAEQVRALLPGTPGNMVVITSRNQLAGLVAFEGAEPIRLEAMTDWEAQEMLGRRLGADRVGADPRAVDDIVAACTGLPLALAVVAARAAIHPELPLARLAATTSCVRCCPARSLPGHGRELGVCCGPRFAVRSWTHAPASRSTMVRPRRSIGGYGMRQRASGDGDRDGL